MNRRDDIDFDRSRAILLGTSAYKRASAILTPIPAAKNSLSELRELLTSTCEWPAARVTTLADKPHGGLLTKISKLIEEVEDVLLVYYVGHGLPISMDGRYDLGLAVTDTDSAVTLRSSTSLRLRDLREQMESSRARVKILILDCCNAGIATRYADQFAWRGGQGPGNGAQRSGGTYIWAACGHAQKTYFEEKEGGLTYFTKFLAEAVRDARELPPPGIDLSDLNDEVSHRFEVLAGVAPLKFADTPNPHVHHNGRSDGFRFVRSRGSVYFVPPHQFEKLAAEDPPTVGPYELKARLGAGGVGRIYLAVGKHGEPAAVKVMHPEFGRDPGFAELFATESLAARKIRSPFVARMLTADPSGGNPWLAMEYVCGPTLHELVRQVGPLPARDILKVAAGVAQGLQAVHATATVHRDLKPGNIMVDETGPKIIDFGIAKSVAATKAVTTHRNFGTPAYKSPEQIKGQKVTGKSDVFSLGATLYFLATGRHAFQPEDEGELVAFTHLICNTEPDFEAVQDTDVRRVIEACMEKDPEKRPDPEALFELCSTAVGGLAPGATLPIDAAGGPIRARAQALRALLTAPEKPTVIVDKPPKKNRRRGDPPGTGSNANPGRAVAAVAVAVLVLTAVTWLPSHWHALFTAGRPSSSGSPSATQYLDTTPTPTDPGPQISSYSPLAIETTTAPPTVPTTPSAVDTPSTSAPGPLQTAKVGDCFAATGTYEHPQPQRAPCNPGNFRVALVLSGTTDHSGCANAANVDYAITNSDDDLVVCLTFLASGDSSTTTDAYHAKANSCVAGNSGSGQTWFEYSCVVGDYVVLARLTDTADTSQCRSYNNYDANRYYNPTFSSQLDVVLCLSVNYPDAAGHATVNTCLYTSNGTVGSFQNVPCNQANAVVVSRINQFDDNAYCNGYPWVSWHSGLNTSIAYTVCYRRV
jgi:serine/threonine protein kinase